MAIRFLTGIDPTSGDRAITPIDIVLGGALVGVAILSGVYVDASRPDTIEPSTWWHWLIIALPPLLVIVRRISPTAIALLGAAVQAMIWIAGLPDVLLPMLVLLYTASSDDGERGVLVSAIITAALTVVTAIGVTVTDDVTPSLIPLVTISFGTAIVLGTSAARQRRVAGDLATAVAESRLRSEHERAAAIADERSHIARELHDVIGHTLSVIAVRAEAADRVAAEQPDAARDAVRSIAGSARSALADTRRVLAGLRASADVELAPPPDLEATRQLVTGLGRAGIDASITMSGCDGHPPSPLVAGGAFRIVQESLTNAVKHGPPNVRIEVEMDCGATQLEITVSSTLRTGFGPPTATDGSGLAGMAERADVLGGSLEAGPRNHRFVVHAVLPTNVGPAGDHPLLLEGEGS